MSRYSLTSFVFVVALLLAAILNAWVTIPIFVYVILFLIYLTFLVYGSSVLSFQFYMPAWCRGVRGEKQIAITFDDGPFAGKTESVLDILTQHEVPAAFFCIGKNGKVYPELLSRISTLGHLVGNHSFHHGHTFDLQSSEAVREELTNTDTVVQQATGYKPKFFRPPYGVSNPMIAKALKKTGHIAVGWSVRSFDTVITDQQKLLKRVTRNLRDGDIVLFHDHSETMIAMLPDFLTHVKKAGLKIVRVDALLKKEGYA